MKFPSIYTPDAKTTGARPSKEHMAEMGKLIEVSMKAGGLLATGGSLPISKGGARVRSSQGEITVIEGPFTEAKELIAGFAVIEAKSKEEAIEGVRSDDRRDRACVPRSATDRRPANRPGQAYPR